MLTEFVSVNVIDFIWEFTLLNVVSEKSLDQGPKALPSLYSNLKKNVETNTCECFINISLSRTQISCGRRDHTRSGYEIRHHSGNVASKPSFLRSRF